MGSRLILVDILERLFLFSVFFLVGVGLAAILGAAIQDFLILRKGFKEGDKTCCRE